jgi:hypothetical protein
MRSDKTTARTRSGPEKIAKHREAKRVVESAMYAADAGVGDHESVRVACEFQMAVADRRKGETVAVNPPLSQSPAGSRHTDDVHGTLAATPVDFDEDVRIHSLAGQRQEWVPSLRVAKHKRMLKTLVQDLITLDAELAAAHPKLGAAAQRSGHSDDLREARIHLRAKDLRPVPICLSPWKRWKDLNAASSAGTASQHHCSFYESGGMAGTDLYVQSALYNRRHES